VFLGEQLSWVQGAGTVLVMTGVIAVSLDTAPPARATEPEV
jgi:drug/metabolite transporter (DMT)-like permease